MAAPTLHRAKSTVLQVEISSTLTSIPGQKDVKVSGFDNEVLEEKVLAEKYPVVITSGTVTVGKSTSAVLWDPLNTAQQFLHARKNDGAEVTGKIIWGATGVEETCKFVINKFERNAEAGGGLMADLEVTFTEEITLNESSPA